MQTTAFGSVLRTVGELGFGATRISYEILILLGNLHFLVFEGRLVKPDITCLICMHEDGLLVILFKCLPARNMSELTDLAELIASFSLHTEFVARGFSFEPRE